MTSRSDNPTDTEINRSLLVKRLLKRLKPDKWPFNLDDLPEGSVLVGGSIRDILLNKQYMTHDLDFVLPKHSIDTCIKLAQKYGGKAIVLDPKRDIARYVFKEWKIDLASQIGKNLKEDLLARDFTINAIALRWFPVLEVLDPSGGLEDLFNKKLVAIAEKNILEDPLRILRGVRLISEFNFAIDHQTQELLKKNATLLKGVASERIKVEIERLIQGNWADDAIRFLIKLDLLKDPWRGSYYPYVSDCVSLKNVSSFSPNELKLALPLVRLTYLLSEEGLVDLGFSRKIIKSCNFLRFWHHKYDDLGYTGLNEVERLQLHMDLENHLPALILLLSSDDQQIWLERWRDPLDPLFHPSSPINGNALKETFQVKEGPVIGKLIYLLTKERAFGRLQKLEEAFTLARYWLEHN
ncbi:MULTISPECIES: CCA tRNA nucleotidyltransferase [unclassified Prochlorococcus]|uniref:CCA tRNA nucleotidyltransferase n=1 Tax=unclassified Prochlorococcus TaxID=2627481 RepID=UPI000563A239|nr:MULTISPECIES: CCA tRNA nucleotidyltransferase [unclassified Prochlorococcus]